MAATLGVAAIGAWAVTTEQVSYEITHGVSMYPVYHQGDLVFLAKADSYEVGEIAAYRAAGNGPVVLHRIIDGDASSFTFKGDNNQSVDVDKPSADKLIGRAVLHVPKGGYWLGPVLSPTGLGMIGFMIISGGGAGIKTRRDRRRARRRGETNNESHHSPLSAVTLVIRSIAELPPQLRTTAAGLAAVTLLSFLLAALTFAGPAVALVRPGSDGVPGRPGTGQSMTFSYSASVPRTPAYDGTTAGSPDPIFRKLAHLVDVRLAYRGSPGSVAVDATVSAAGGWHTTLVLLPETAFADDRYDGVVRLDLDAIDARAHAAADAIGVQPNSLDVTVSAHVVAADGSRFTPTLPLILAPLQMSLAGGEASLTVDDTSAAAVRSRNSSLFGIVSVAAARRSALCLLFGALLGLIGLVVVARRNAPAPTDAEIRRRYSHLLVPVEPMDSPPGKPIVNVHSFETLVRMADRFGLLVLHWSRGDSETFVVRDSGKTYRYRTGPDDDVPLTVVDGGSLPPPAPATTETPATTGGRRAADTEQRR